MIVNYEFLTVFVFTLFSTLIFYVQQQHAVSVALYMFLNIFFKLYDLNGNDYIENNFNIFFNWILFLCCFDVLKEFSQN